MTRSTSSVNSPLLYTDAFNYTLYMTVGRIKKEVFLSHQSNDERTVIESIWYSEYANKVRTW